MRQKSTRVDPSQLVLRRVLLAENRLWLPLSILDVQEVHLVLYPSHHFFVVARRRHHIDPKLFGLHREMPHLAKLHWVLLPSLWLFSLLLFDFLEEGG